MELSIYENEAPAGTLRIYPQGLYTVFEARLPPGTELSRLWLLGAGRRWCLGLLEPREEGRFLRRRLTRLQMAALPPRIERALVTASSATPPCAAPSAPNSEFRIPNSQFSWTRLPDGSLRDPARRVLALPCAPGAAPARARKITLGGRDYWLFRY